MGWLFQNKKLRHETPVQYIIRELTHTSGPRQATVLAAAAVGGTIYAAVRNTDTETGQNYVFCAVILFKNNGRDGFGYKDMDESCGPCEVDCPDRIFKLLSPIAEMPSPGYAAEWRDRVTAAKAQRNTARKMLRRLSVGQIIRVAQPAHFQKRAVTEDRFRLVAFQHRTPIFEPVGNPTFRCRLPQNMLMTAMVED